ncbi:TRAP transporter substrate-binding protein [Oscillospiraceae bacterium LTW-04]|nr:TRAP transporter substrate-binding protein [Oscillospiraceae bacterium MB24-C1]
MKKTLSILISSLLLLSLAACGSSSTAPASSAASSAAASSSAAPADDGKTYEINIAHIVNEDNSWHKASVFFKDYVEKESNGRIKVNIYPNNQLGSEMDVINSIITDGGADITFTGESMQSVIPEMGILGVPYLLRSSEQLQAVANGSVGDKLEQLMLDTANMKVLGYFERGPRNVTSNKEIRTPDDMKGFIIRVPASPITVAAMEALGAKPTPMAFAEVFTSLQQKTIDGQENPLAMIKTGNFYEVQKYLSKTEHLRSWVYIVMSNSKLQSMPEDLQKIVIDGGAEMQKYEHEIFLKDEQELEKFLQDKGMTIISDVDQEAFAAMATEGVEEVLPEKIRPLYDEIKAMG